MVGKQEGGVQLRFSVQPPDGVPRTAQVTVYLDKSLATSIVGRPVYFFDGDEGAPDAEALKAAGSGR